MRVEPPLGHGTTLGGLWRAAREHRLPHALLFEGPGGIGKFLASNSRRAHSSRASCAAAT